VWMLLILSFKVTFQRFCQRLNSFGVPDIFIVQLLLLHRYLFLLRDEGLSLKRARDCRSFGRKGRDMRIASKIIGALFLRTIERAERIYRCMLCRGFRGVYNRTKIPALKPVEYCTIFLNGIILLFLRVFFS